MATATMKDIMFQKDYHFNIKDAMDFGLPESVMLANIKWWVIKNKANEKNFHDDRTWTYNSVRAYGDLFPFWSDKQVRRILDSLVTQGVLMSGNYNKTAYDRTKWYALVDEMKTLCPNGQMEVTKGANQSDQKGEPIPYINTDVKPDKPPIGEVVNIKDKTTEQRKELIVLFKDGYMSLYGIPLDLGKKEIGCINNILKKENYKEKVETFRAVCVDMSAKPTRYGWFFTPSKCIGKWNEIITGKDTVADLEADKKLLADIDRKKREEIKEREQNTRG